MDTGVYGVGGFGIWRLRVPPLISIGLGADWRVITAGVQ